MLIQSLQIGSVNGYWNAWTCSRRSARQQSASLTRGRRQRGPGTGHRAETRRSRGDRVPTPRPGRTPGEGMDRVSDPARSRPPLARGGLGTGRARAHRVSSVSPKLHQHAMPKAQGTAEECPSRSSRGALVHGPIGRGRCGPESPGSQAILRQFQTLCERRSAQCRDRRDSR